MILSGSFVADVSDCRRGFFNRKFNSRRSKWLSIYGGDIASVKDGPFESVENFLAVQMRNSVLSCLLSQRQAQITVCRELKQG